MEPSQEEQYLQILSIFHYVIGGITALFACFPIFHLAMGMGMLTGAFETQPGEEFPLRIVGLIFVLLPGCIIVAGWLLAGAMVATGYFLAQRRRHLFCMIVAGIECIFMPLGTVLGVFTIIMLVRPTVKERFEPDQARRRRVTGDTSGLNLLNFCTENGERTELFEGDGNCSSPSTTE